jgi:predicted nucleotidyltransferase
MLSTFDLQALQISAGHLEALQQVLCWVPKVVEPLGLVVTGSIVRGNPDPHSDLDIVVLHQHPWRRRVQRWFNGTPTELFFNSEAWWCTPFSRKPRPGGQ